MVAVHGNEGCGGGRAGAGGLCGVKGVEAFDDEGGEGGFAWAVLALVGSFIWLDFRVCGEGRRGIHRIRGCRRRLSGGVWRLVCAGTFLRTVVVRSWHVVRTDVHMCAPQVFCTSLSTCSSISMALLLLV